MKNLFIKDTLYVKHYTTTFAIYSVVPGKILRKLGIKPEEEREFILANGEIIKRKLGIARYQYNGNRGGAPVIFGKEDDSILLGATTLVAMGLA